MLSVIATSDPAAPYVLQRRHVLNGRMCDTVISTHPTRNAAYDAHYDELHAIIVPRASARRRPSFERVVTIGGSVSACLTLVAVALAGLLWLGTSIDPGGAYDGAPYAIVTTDR
jgi:hypothetical protein